MNVTHPQSQSPLMSWLGRMPAPVTLLFVDQNSVRTLSVTCKYAQKFFESAKIQGLLLSLHFPLFIPPKEKGQLIHSACYARCTAAYSRKPGIVRHNTITCENVRPHDRIPISPDGKKIIVCNTESDGTRTINLYEIDTGKCIWTLESSFASLVVSPDGKSFLIVTSETISSVNLETKEIISTANYDFAIDYIQISDDGKYAHVVSDGSRDNPMARVECLDLSTGKWGNTFFVQEEFSKILSLSGDGTIAISQNLQGDLLFREVQTGNIVKTLKDLPLMDRLSCKISPNRAKLLFVDSDRCLTVWDLNTGKSLCSIPSISVEFRNLHLDLHTTFDMKRAIIADSGHIVLLDLELGRRLESFNVLEGEKPRYPYIWALQIKPDGTGFICTVISATNCHNALIKSFDFGALPIERIGLLAKLVLSSHGEIHTKLFNLLPGFAWDEICHIRRTLFDDNTDEIHKLQKSIDIYAAKVFLPSILRLLIRAAKEQEEESELAPIFFSRAVLSVGKLPPAVREAVYRNFYFIQKERGRSAEDVLNNPRFAQYFEDGSLMEDGIEAITRTMAEYMTKTNGSTEGKSD